MATDNSTTSTPSKSGLAKFLLFGLAIILLLPGINRGFILDEYKTWMNCLLSLDVLIRDRLLSGHFPTYFVLTQVWSQLAGVAEWALRVPSILMVALAVPLVYDICLALWDKRTALACAIVFAGHQLVVWMGQTARPYAGLLLFSVLAAWCVVHWLENGGKRYLAGLFLSTIAGLSFMPLFGLAPLGLIVACLLGTKSRRKWGAILTSLAGLVIMALPMLHLGRQQEKFEVKSSVEGNALLRALEGVQDLWLGDFDSWGRGALAYVTLVLMIVLVIWVVRNRKSRDVQGLSPEVLALAWFAVPTLALAIAQGVTHRNLLSHERYYAPALGGMALVIGRGLALGIQSAKMHRWHWVIVGLSMFMLAANTIGWWFDKGEGPRETTAEMLARAGGVPKQVAGHVRWLRYELKGKQPEREFYLERGDAKRVDSLLGLFMNAEEGDQVAYYTQGQYPAEVGEQLAEWAKGEPFWIFVYLNGKDALDRLAKEPPSGYKRSLKLDNLDARAYLFEPVGFSSDSETTETENSPGQ